MRDTSIVCTSYADPDLVATVVIGFRRKAIGWLFYAIAAGTAIKRMVKNLDG
jgi:hypothetical protein